MALLFGDFETRSRVDLVARGAYVYAADDSTDTLCFSWAIEDDPIRLWVPWHEPLPVEIFNFLTASGNFFAAWNAQFERLIWNGPCVRRYNAPQLPIEKFICVAALSRARGFPGKLEKAAKFADAKYKKDMDGHRLMLKLCKPDSDGNWNEDPEELKRLGDYCLQDSEVERALYRSLIPFTSRELSAYHRTEHLNDRGIRYDHTLAAEVVKAVENEQVDSSSELARLTNDEVTSPNQVAKILAWCESQGYKLQDLAKSTVCDALDTDEIPDIVRSVLEIRQDQAKAAVSKFKAMAERGHEEVLRGLFMFRGAGQTGRYSSIGVQIHNLLRESAPEAIPVFMKHGLNGLRTLTSSPVHLLAKMVRPTFIASPGKTFLIGDFAQIEARIVAWLSQEDWLLTAFREKRDVYCEFGAEAFGRPITKADEMERLASKCCVLGLGFGGAEGALRRSLKGQANIALAPETETHLVLTYRDKCRRVKRYWYLLKDTVLAAMYSPNSIVEIQGHVAYLFDGVHLWCKLPSDRLMCYPFAEIVIDDYGYEVVRYRRGNRAPKNGETEWPTVDLWYGLLMENLAQAIALDLLEEALERIEAKDDFFIRAHVHDECIAETEESRAEKKLPEFLHLMKQLPDWAEGLPVEAEGHISRRYVK